MLTIENYNEREIVSAIAKGDEESFAIFFNHYRAKIFSFLLKFTKDKEVAEDLLQDIFLKIWLKRDTLPAVENVNAYLHQMAKNTALNLLKNFAQNTLAIQYLNVEVADNAVTSDEMLQHSELRETIDEAINSLTQQQRNVYCMSREMGLKQNEIANRLNISIFTVKKHLTDARNKLKGKLMKKYPTISILLFFVYKAIALFK